MSARLAWAWSCSKGMTSGGAGDGGGVVGEVVRDLLGDVAGDEGSLLLRAVGDQYRCCSLLDEVSRGELGHLACADE